MTSQLPLKEISLKIGSGITPRGGADVYIDRGITLIRSQNVYNREFEESGLVFIDDEVAERMAGSTVMNNDILLNITGDSVARCCLVPEEILPARVNQHVAIIRIDSEKNNPEYVMYYLTSPSMQARMLSLSGSGGTRKALTKQMIEAFEVPHLSTRIQDRVVDVLSTYDKLIKTNRQRIQLLEEAARQVYQEWFVRLRFPGYQQTPIYNGLPEGWKRGVVNDFYETASGGTPSRKNPEYYKGSINWVKTQELEDGFIFETSEKITEDALRKSSAKLFPPNTVLIAMYGATVGRTGILITPSATNQACCAILPSEEVSYGFTFLTFIHKQEDLMNAAIGAAQPNISQQIIRNTPFVLPSREAMRSFDNLLSINFDQMKTLTLQNHALKRARDLLLPRLIRGELIYNVE